MLQAAPSEEWHQKLYTAGNYTSLHSSAVTKQTNKRKALTKQQEALQRVWEQGGRDQHPLLLK